MDRRQFLAQAGLVATWACIAIHISGCSDSSGPGDDTGEGDIVGVVTGQSHTHSGAVVTKAEQDAGDAVTLTLEGSGHSHIVELTADQVMDIADGTEVAVLSSTTNAHNHTVTFN